MKWNTDKKINLIYHQNSSNFEKMKIPINLFPLFITSNLEIKSEKFSENEMKIQNLTQAHKVSTIDFPFSHKIQ